MRFVVLRTDDELNRYRKVTEKYINVLLPLEYLKRSRVVAYVRKDGAYCGGMVFVKTGPFRVLESIPEDAPNLLPVDEKDIVEVTGFWLDRKLSSSKISSLTFWLKFYRELLFRGRKGFVYAYSLKKGYLEKLYANGNPTSLFRGATKVLDGMEDAELEAVEFVPWANLLTGPFRKPQFLMRRATFAVRKQLTLIGRNSRKVISTPVEDYPDELEIR